MSKKCIICGRQIKTGRKYCYEHRNSTPDESSFQSEKKIRKKYIEEANREILIAIAFIFLGFISFFNSSPQIKLIGFLFIILGVLAFIHGMKERKNVNNKTLLFEKKAIKEKLISKKRRENLLEEVKKDLRNRE
jgi:predicted RND superfamily exporter protein